MLAFRIKMPRTLHPEDGAFEWISDGDGSDDDDEDDDAAEHNGDDDEDFEADWSVHRSRTTRTRTFVRRRRITGAILEEFLHKQPNQNNRDDP